MRIGSFLIDGKRSPAGDGNAMQVKKGCPGASAAAVLPETELAMAIAFRNWNGLPRTPLNTWAASILVNSLPAISRRQ